MNQAIAFTDLGLPEPLLQAVREVGYESPSPIQAACIPLLLEGHDLLGQAQTGTGKTAAFALPLLARVDISDQRPQLLVLTPTRELAIQVAEAMQTYAHFLKGFHVLPIYGGQGYGHQLQQLRRGVQVIVGTPGRIMDHMERGALKLDALRALVLDEADEMLRMGFIDDVEWILSHTPERRQIALFSATMPKVIREIANRHLVEPKTVKIESKTTTAATIRQRYWTASGLHKLDALTRILETEDFDAMLVFVRTKTATVELAEKLAARGFACEALNGDIPQVQRERTVERLRGGKLDILVATDVVARGLDVQRISHVINYDIPYDAESYVHRIGRTGRAGREGEAILFVAPRERYMLRTIEKATRQPIEPMQMPTLKDINQSRLARFKQRILDTLGSEADLALFYRLIKEVEVEADIDPAEIAAALAYLLQGESPLLLPESGGPSKPAEAREPEPAEARLPRRGKELEFEPKPLKDFPELEMQRYRIAVGYRDGVKPGNIVGAIANEAEIESKYIGHIEIFDDFSTVDLPAGMPDETLEGLKKVWVCQRQLRIEPLREGEAGERVPPSKSRTPGKPRHKAKSGTKGKTHAAASRGDKAKAGGKAGKSKPKKS